MRSARSLLIALAAIPFVKEVVVAVFAIFAYFLGGQELLQTIMELFDE